jgi:hypothetical protein
MGTLEQFCGNTVEISENSKNHLEAIVGGRQVLGGMGLGRGPKKWQKNHRAKKERLTVEHSSVSSADWRESCVGWTAVSCAEDTKIWADRPAPSAGNPHPSKTCDAIVVDEIS